MPKELNGLSDRVLPRQWARVPMQVWARRPGGEGGVGGVGPKM